MKATIEQERESFKKQQARHIRNFGEPKRVLSQPEPDLPEPHVEKMVEKQSDEVEISDQPENPAEKEHTHTNHHHHDHHHHDESADVLEEADEDMVIY